MHTQYLFTEKKEELNTDMHDSVRSVKPASEIHREYIIKG